MSTMEGITTFDRLFEKHFDHAKQDGTMLREHFHYHSNVLTHFETRGRTIIAWKYRPNPFNSILSALSYDYT